MSVPNLQQLCHLETILKRQPRPPRVLEIGGTGEWRAALQHRARSWTQVADTPLPCESFDLIFLNQILERKADDQLGELVQEARNHLAPGGVLYALCWIIPGLYPRWNFQDSPFRYRKEEDYFRLFCENGFRITVEREEWLPDQDWADQSWSLWLEATGLVGITRRLLELSPLPQYSQFLLYAS